MDLPDTDEADWRALAERTLKGAGVESLVRHTVEGLPIRPLYPPAAAPAPLRSVAEGAPPWDVRVTVAHPDPVRANALALEALEAGAHSIALRLDPSGAAGVAVGGVGDLERALDGVVLDVAPVALEAGFMGPRAADALATVAKASPRAPLDFGLDPLSAFAAAGESPGPIQGHLISAAQVAARLADAHPAARLFRASGRVVHEAGGGEALEIAFAAASALAYAKAMARVGLPIERAFAGLTFELAVDTDAFLAIAKLRAARQVFARLATACGASPAVRIGAVSSRRMLAARDVWNNMIRLTIAGFAGAIGSADSLTLGCFSDPLGHPAALARRQSRNIHFILMEEAHLGRVDDPAAGAGYAEAMTAALARAAWDRFQTIEAAGGVVAALSSGRIAEVVEGARGARAPGRMVGVTDFVLRQEPAVETEPARASAALPPNLRLPGPDSRCPPLRSEAWA